MNELVSIIIPIYNMGEQLKKSIKSILNQDYSNYEVLLIDDGSEDNSFQICKEIAENNPRVKCYHTENQGSGPARNVGIQNASGKYAYFPDADDWLAPNAISSCVSAMENFHCDLLVFGFKILNQKGKQIKEKVYSNKRYMASVLKNNYVNCMDMTAKNGIQGAPWNKFFRLSVIREFGIEYPSLRRHQDEGFISRYMCHANSICFISDIYYSYYANTQQLEWKKYPIDYIDAVIGLYNVRKDTILTWNSNDIETHNLVHRSYICSVIKALELSFSPKFNFKTIKSHLSWMKDVLEKSNILEVPKVKLGIYQKILFNLIANRMLNLVYIVIGFKVKLYDVFR